MIAAFAAAVIGTPTYLIHAQNRGQTALDDAFGQSAGHMTYRLEGAHMVAADYGAARYFYNFDNKTVFAGAPEKGGQGGGLTSFRGLDNPARIEDARKQGCSIAARAITLPNHGFPVTAEFTQRQLQAAQFSLNYCR